MMDIKRKAVLMASIFLILASGLTVWVAPSQAISWGQEDTGLLYPNVGAVLVRFADSGELELKCSGTLISETVFLTAGHCTSTFSYWLDTGEIKEIYVSFDLKPTEKNAQLIEVSSVITHPDYNAHMIGEVGILILSEPVLNIAPAKLAEEGFLDQLREEGKLCKRGRKTKFTVVGYGGMLEWPPPKITYPDTRSYAKSGFRALLKAWLRLSQNQATGDGGTCPGDSGGPVFWEEDGERILVAITSWGDAQSVSASFNYRVDIPDTLSFIQDNMPP